MMEMSIRRVMHILSKNIIYTYLLYKPTTIFLGIIMFSSITLSWFCGLFTWLVDQAIHPMITESITKSSLYPMKMNDNTTNLYWANP